MNEKQKDYLTEGDGFIDIKLRSPATIGGAKVGTLRMREPSVQDQLALERMTGSESEREIKLFANLCEVAPEDMQKLTLRNYHRVQEAWQVFTD